MKKSLTILAVLSVVALLGWSYYVYAENQQFAGRLMLLLFMAILICWSGIYFVKLQAKSFIKKRGRSHGQRQQKIITTRYYVNMLFHMGLTILMNIFALGLCHVISRAL